ncbi:MAG: Holliday junction branch migration DNA helicase RuvB [Lachnospiraceae bacterium]|nr:Holliday junction branch migration DNA helicase RuvB [Lachnospiraceae bacterium]MBR2755441.1 Holliday junction branch migration DNA helicase RuvB [Lachnospiraceae bacterium]MBR2842524.1 Holliday junction branch migration DNA helicase RuvB [Lachnospiraceae bacterium]MBR3263007.1 Holliday junction branch migration DNA helicase RuvB [Lachnospiraceae bacterium]MBR3360932.1 Holliday junction branch migration DNA helicase RuvB [Lachnospiraceae bacterium]
MAKDAINTNLIMEEKEVENNLRPQDFDSYIGQEKIKNNLKIYIQAANERNEPIDHVLLYGPPGLGKTTLAGIIANSMGRSMKIVSGPAIEYPGEILAIIKQLPKGGVLFVDEIHRLSKPVEEALYSVMEDFAFDAVIENGEQTTVRRISVDRFTLIGATTRAGLLSAPLRDRFGIIHRMEYYEPEELAKIVINSAKKLAIDKVDPSGAIEIGNCSRGTPRIANRILRRVRDYAQVKADGNITKEVVDETLALLDIDQKGLDLTDRNILLTMISKFNGGPVGLDTLAAAIGEDPGTIEDVYEPYLVKCGFINRTPRGRMATDYAYSHLNMTKIEP